MIDQILQFLLTGITVGATYALVALGFAIIYNASDVVNFAQGEFVMMGAMSAVSLSAGDGLPMSVALPLAVLLTVGVGLLLQRFAIAPARGASVVTTIIITTETRIRTNKRISSPCRPSAVTSRFTSARLPCCPRTFG